MKRADWGIRFVFIPVRAKIAIGFILVVLLAGLIATMNFSR